jgi:hypothetical protein
MAIKIRKCANPKCADIVGSFERTNKKYCSVECKTRFHNDSIKKGVVTWDKIMDKYLDKYDDMPTDIFHSLPKWLKENYYPPRIIKQKK